MDGKDFLSLIYYKRAPARFYLQNLEDGISTADGDFLEMRLLLGVNDLAVVNDDSEAVKTTTVNGPTAGCLGELEGVVTEEEL